MTYTTLADYEDYAGEVFDAAGALRVTRMLSLAERMLARRAGTVFYVDGDELLAPGLRSDASKDWIYVTCVITDWMLVYDDKDIRADLAGPYRSERLGDWSMTLRDGMWTPFSDIRIWGILRTYRTTVAASNRYITAVGPRTLAQETAEQ